MKTIKAGLWLITLLLAACTQPSGWQEVFDEESIAFPANESEKELKAATQYTVWSVSFDADWFDVATVSGGILIAVDANETDQVRTGTINFVVSGTVVDRLRVIQEANSLSVTTAPYDLTSAEGEISFQIQSTLGWECAVEADWIDVVEIESSGMKFSIARNYSMDPRTASIVFTSGAVSQTIELEQPGCEWYESFRMMPIPEGTFLMGAQASSQDADNYDHYAFQVESPVHSVSLSAFSIGAFEVTQRQWVAAMGGDVSEISSPDCPVENISWVEVQTFIEALNSLSGLNYRLPTEAEWEYAARGDGLWMTTNDYYSWSYYNGDSQTHPVGLLEPNVWGLYDMLGNVCEWCADWFGTYPAYAENDPTGPEYGDVKVVRGGGWRSVEANCRVTYRDHANPEAREPDLGFRLAL